jgi:hypothetical protein
MFSDWSQKSMLRRSSCRLRKIAIFMAFMPSYLFLVVLCLFPPFFVVVRPSWPPAIARCSIGTGVTCSSKGADTMLLIAQGSSAGM